MNNDLLGRISLLLSINTLFACPSNCQVSKPLPEGTYVFDGITKQVQLSAKSIEHGKKQIRVMIKDRPEMSKYVVPGDLVWNWTVRQFAGEGFGSKINWESELPDIKAPAVNHYERGAIRVGTKGYDGRLLDGETQWWLVVGELYNIRNGPNFAKVANDVEGGHVSRQDWTRRNTQLEYQALKSINSFFRNVFVPNSKSKKIIVNARLWDSPPNYDDWIRSSHGQRYVKYWNDGY